MTHKPLPIGVENFEDIITNEYYYIDKTPFIKELIDKKGKVNLFTRPRRFGKSLTISMLQYFFDETKKDKAYIFEGLKIVSESELYTSQMNKYPVICITLKEVKGDKFVSAYNMYKILIAREYKRHIYIKDQLETFEKEKYMRILQESGDFEEYKNSLKFLSECLEQYYNKKVIILIDEYDVPLETSYFDKYYVEMVRFVRSLFEAALKTNNSLNFAVLTGCLRISKESIFTGLNNLNIISITSSAYGEYFGFTEKEVYDMLLYYKIEHKSEEVRRWYNGYIFGEANVYNPWSMVKYIFDVIEGKKKYPEAHWANTSSNNIVRKLIEISDDTAKEEVTSLIRGESIIKPIHEDIVYSEIYSNINNLWNFLFYTGYLKKIDEKFEDEQTYFELKIPNSEVLYIYKRKIREWFEEKTKITDSNIILKAIIDKDTESLSNELSKRLMSIISFFDSHEDFYHGFLLGMLSNVQGYIIKSNRESGNGRSDIFMKDKGINKKAMVFELKIVGDKDDPEEKCREALQQIEDKKYAYDLEEEGYRNILCYGIAFRGKECMIRTK